jgi:hypothetical protein
LTWVALAADALNPVGTPGAIVSGVVTVAVFDDAELFPAAS